VETAFRTAKVSEGDEQDFVDRLRRGSDYIPELALVTEDHGKLIGHIMLTRMFVSANGRQHPVLLLAAVSVVLERRNQGIGSQLISEAFRRARDRNHKSVIVVGNPAYYSRFGFKSSVTFGIKNLNLIEDEFVMACALTPDGLREVAGSISLPT
jgi:putative acetyltransferase